MPTHLFQFHGRPLLFNGFAIGQPQPAFEVASLRASGTRHAGLGPLPIDGTITGGPGIADPSRIVYSRVPLQIILINAFDIPVDQLLGPDWIVSERFDMVANVPPRCRVTVAARFCAALRRQSRKTPKRTWRLEPKVKLHLGVSRGRRKGA
jgi:hypothetical protein